MKVEHFYTPLKLGLTRWKTNVIVESLCGYFIDYQEKICLDLDTM